MSDPVSAAASASPVVAGTPAKQACDLGQEALVLVVEFVGQRQAVKLRCANRTFKVKMVYMVSWGLCQKEKVVRVVDAKQTAAGPVLVTDGAPTPSPGRSRQRGCKGHCAPFARWRLLPAC